MRVKTETMVQKKDGTRIYDPRMIQEVYKINKRLVTINNIKIFYLIIMYNRKARYHYFFNILVMSCFS